MLKILLFGANGKMGRIVSSLASADPDCEIAAGVDIKTQKYDDFEIYPSVDGFGGKADVIIDFSHPSLLDSTLSYAVASKTPAVIATTGIDDEQFQKIIDAAMKVPVFFTANMSIGVNLMVELISRAAAVLEGNFDIEIVERHHNQKIDAPSGTALMLADTMSEALKNKPTYVYDRHAERKKRSACEIGISSVRGGSIVGDHEVIFAGNNEVIEISHHAYSKEVFAVGALRAAKYIFGKDPGMYNMKDLVKNS